MKVAILGGTGPFGRALAVRLKEAGEDDVVVGSRDDAKARDVAEELGVAGAQNDAAVAGADLVVIACNADAAVATARANRDSLGAAPVLSVASELRFRNRQALPQDEPLSLAEQIAKVVDAPVVAGLHSLAAGKLAAGRPDEDALICGDDDDAKAVVLEAAGRIVAGRVLDVGPLERARGNPAHRRVNVTPVTGLPEIAEGDDLAALIAERTAFEDGDVLVVAQKAVSKAEGRVVRLDELEPSDRARELAADDDPRRIEAILREAEEVVRARPPLVIARTRHGFVCGSAGVDASNAPEPGTLVLLPLDPDASAARIRERIRELTGKDVGVIVADSFGRPFRMGTTDVAIGAAGIRVLEDLRGTRDRSGYELRSTQIAVADELAGAAQLVMGKADGIPAAVLRGLDLGGDGSARDLVIPPDRDLFSSL